MNKQEDLKKYAQIDAEAAALTAVNEKRIYPFRKNEFILGFMEGRLSSERERRNVSEEYVERMEQEIDYPHWSVPERSILRKALKWYRRITHTAKQNQNEKLRLSSIVLRGGAGEGDREAGEETEQTSIPSSKGLEEEDKQAEGRQ